MESGEKAQFKLAITKEWQSWISSGAAIVIAAKDVPCGKQIMRTRNVLTWKNVTDDKGKITGKKAKCRLVILGFEDWRAVH